MGTDIHCVAEIRRPKHGGKWEPALSPIPNKYFQPDEPQDESNRKLEYPRLIRWRNYDLFAMLAGVRNGRGFAGVVTGAGFNPISEPRGLPDDLSPHMVIAAEPDGFEITDQATVANEMWKDEVAVSSPVTQHYSIPSAYEMPAVPAAVLSTTLGFPDGTTAEDVRFWLGDHSFTHITLAELLAYDWQQQTISMGHVSLSVYAKYRQDLQWNMQDEGHGSNVVPESACGGVSGAHIKHVSIAEADRLVDEALAAHKVKHGNPWHRNGGIPLEFPADLLGSGRDFQDQGPSIYVQMAWPVTYNKEMGDDMKNTILRLCRIAHIHGISHDDVRLVMGFDS